MEQKKLIISGIRNPTVSISTTTFDTLDFHWELEYFSKQYTVSFVIEVVSITKPAVRPPDSINTQITQQVIIALRLVLNVLDAKG